MSSIFSYSMTTKTLPNPLVSNEYTVQKIHSTGRTAGGQFYRYSKGINIKTVKIKWDFLTDNQKNDLESFFYTTVSGPTTDFTYTDHNSTSWTAHFLQDKLEFKEVDDNGTCGGIWETEIEMEVW